MSDIIKELIRYGPYRGNYEGDLICGFCGFELGHSLDCPWVMFRDGVLLVWPEWVADLNATDQQERLDAEARAKEGWVDV